MGVNYRLESGEQKLKSQEREAITERDKSPRFLKQKINSSSSETTGMRIEAGMHSMPQQNSKSFCLVSASDVAFGQSPFS